jgi:hypothetical protein
LLPEYIKIDPSGDRPSARRTNARVALCAALTALDHRGFTAFPLMAPAVERGMAVSIVEYKVGKTLARTAMYRSPDGKIQQFLINRQREHAAAPA